ncbi:unnamed protein product, partial [Gordionus sp. m RMFG-2023]
KPPPYDQAPLGFITPAQNVQVYSQPPQGYYQNQPMGGQYYPQQPYNYAGGQIPYGQPQYYGGQPGCQQPMMPAKRGIRDCWLWTLCATCLCCCLCNDGYDCCACCDGLDSCCC